MKRCLLPFDIDIGRRGLLRGCEKIGDCDYPCLVTRQISATVIRDTADFFGKRRKKKKKKKRRNCFNG